MQRNPGNAAVIAVALVMTGYTLNGNRDGGALYRRRQVLGFISAS